MAGKMYQLLFAGLLGEEKKFREMMHVMGVRPSLVDQMLREAPIIVKQNLSLQSARKYAELMSAMGAKITILDQFPQSGDEQETEPPSPMSSFVPCPQCGLVQSNDDICPRCGFRLTGQGGKGEGRVPSNRT